MNTDDLVYRIWCVLALGAGHRLINVLLKRYDDDAGKVYMALAQDESLRMTLTDRVINSVDRVTIGQAESVLEICSRRGIGIITSKSSQYPQRLENVVAPPTVLFYKGDISAINNVDTLGMVGARKPSEYSRQVADSVAMSAARNGIAVVSGFAEGIDICSALSAIRSRGRTFAVLGCGVDVDYPKSNYRYRETVAMHGALISEFPPGTEPLPANFPQRNRILSALSDAVAVIEASEKSGALNTASHAAEQGRDVLVVPPADLFDKRYKGQAELIRDGAIPLMGMRDVLGCFSIEVHEPTEKKEKENVQEKPQRQSKPVKQDNPAENKPSKPVKQDKKAKRELEKKEATPQPAPSFPEGEINSKIADALSENGRTLSYLTDNIDCETDELLAALTELELEGFIINDGTVYKINN